MGKYLDRLNAEYTEILDGIETVTNRAADEGRDLTPDETAIVERDNTRAGDLQKAIEYHAGLEEQRGKVGAALGRATTAGGTVRREKVGGDPKPADSAEELRKLFPTAGDYVTIVGRALRGEADASAIVERALEIDRATEHQVMADNPGLLPRPILGPVIDLVTGNRRFIRSITSRPLPAQKFDRPKISQHVAVGIQEQEKTETSSRRLKVDELPVASKTFAGHLNLSRQNIKWSTPSLMQLVVESFATQYAIETEAYASARFYASLLADGKSAEIDAWSGRLIRRALFAAAAKPLNDQEELGFPDTFWLATDVWGELGSLESPLGQPVFPGLNPAAPNAGTIGGFNAVVVPQLPAGKAVIGRGALVEWYEDLDGLIQVAEPDVLGQLVGYAGDGALLNTAPEAFTVLTFPPITSEPDEASAPEPAAEPPAPAKK